MAKLCFDYEHISCQPWRYTQPIKEWFLHQSDVHASFFSGVVNLSSLDNCNQIH